MRSSDVNKSRQQVFDKVTDNPAALGDYGALQSSGRIRARLLCPEGRQTEIWFITLPDGYGSMGWSPDSEDSPLCHHTSAGQG